MRIISFLLLIYLMALIFTPITFATVPIETLTNQESLDMAKEKSEIEKAINYSKVNPKEFLVDKKDYLGRNELSEIKNSTELEYGNAYKVVITNKNVIQAMIDGTNLATILQTAPYHWEVPVLFKEDSLNKPVASFTVAMHNNEWQIVEIGGYLSPEQSYYSSNPVELINLIKNKSLENANSFVHFRIPSLHTDFLYIATKDQEYFIPLIHGRDDLYGLKNKSVYTRNEVVSAIGSIIKKNLEPNPPIAGYPSSEKNNNKLSIIFIFGIVFTISTFYGYRKLTAKRSTP